MKKKIINGILMVALVAATSTSFVSCKDNSEDVRTDLIYKLDQEKAQLQKDYIQADKDLMTAIKTDINDPNSELAKAFTAWVEAKDYATKDWVKDWCDNKNDYLKSAEFPDTLAKYLKTNADFVNVTNTLWGEDGKSGLVKDVADALARLDAHGDSLKFLDARIDTVNHRIGTIIEALRNMVTSVTVNATSTNILENSKVFPGLNMQFLGAIYGQAKKDVYFPENVEGVTPELIAEQGDLLYNEKRGAGKVYFTINPSNIDAADAEKLTLSLTDSQNGTSLITLGKATKSDKVLAWGTRADGDVTLWEAEATANPKELGQLDPTKIINLNQVGEHVKNMVKAAKNVEKSTSSVKSTTKDILSETVTMIVELAQSKLPALPALALKAQWKDTVGVRSVISDYSIAATAYKPVDFFWGQGIVNEGSSISFDKIDKLALDIVNKIKENEPDMTKYIVNKVSVGPIANTITIYISSGTAAGTHTANISGLAGDINQIVKDLNANLDMLNGAISDIQNIMNKVNNSLDKGLDLEKKVSNFLKSYLNRVISSISANGLYKVLQPIMLFEGENGVNRLISGTTLKAGKVNLVPTSVTNELLAPAFKKYISVNGKGEVLTNGDDNFKKYEITLQKGENKIVYAALDFYGNQVVKTYTVNAE